MAFVRYQVTSGALFDVYAKPNVWPYDPDYILRPADKSKIVMYMLKYKTVRNIPGELRLDKWSYEIFSVNEHKLLAISTSFRYEQFEQDKTFLAAPSGVVCEEIDDLDKFIKTIFPLEKKQ